MVFDFDVEERMKDLRALRHVMTYYELYMQLIKEVSKFILKALGDALGC